MSTTAQADTDLHDPVTAPQPKFKRGDVVHLNSNPEIRMTVRTVDRNTGTVVCNWFDPGRILLGGKFDGDCLTLVVKPPHLKQTFDEFFREWRASVSERPVPSQNLLRDGWDAALKNYQP